MQKIMKNKLFLRVALLAAGFGLAFASCTDSDADPVSTPVFPEPFEATIAPGSQYSFDIEPNMDWEAKIPDEAATYFWFNDNGMKAYTLHGTAGKSTIVVACLELTDFDTEHVCPITLTMAGQTQLIATLTINTEGRTIQVYTAIKSSNPEESGNLFQQDDETGEYSYETNPATEFSMATKSTEYNFMQRIRVESNFDWSIGQYPEWMTLYTTTGSTGKTDLFLLTDSEKYPWEHVTESLVFIDAADLENPVEVATIRVDMPGCGDRVFTTFAKEERFNAAGAYYIAMQGTYGTPETGVFKEFEAAYGSQIVLLVENADGTLSVGDDNSWIRVNTPIEWKEAAKSAGLWSHRIQLLCDENTGKAPRKAYVVAIPRTRAASLDPADLIDGSKVANTYADFVVSTITQNSAAGEYIQIETFEGSEEFFTFTKLPSNDYPFVEAWSNAPVAYNLTYKHPFAFQAAAMEFSEPYASVEFYNEEGPYAQSQISPLWLEIADTDPVNQPGQESIKLIGNYNEDDMTFSWGDVQPELPMAYVVFKNEAGDILGIVEFMFDGEAGSGGGNGGDGEVSLAESIEGVTLAPLAAGEEGFDAEMNYCPQYKLTITNASIKQIKLNLPENTDSENIHFDDELAYLYPNGSSYMLQLFFQKTGSTEILVKDSSSMIIGRILVVYQPE